MPVEAGDINDLVLGTLRHLGRLKFEQMAQALQRYEVLGRWMKKDKVVFDTGRGIQKNLMVRLSNRASHVGLTDTDGSVLPDLMEQLTVPWRHAQTNWSFLFQTDVLMNRGPSLVFNVVKPRRADALISLAEELEAKAWQVPSSTDKIAPYGIPYWIVYNATTGFNGGAPSGHSTVAGISLTDAPNFKNYTYQYTTVNKPDLIKNMRTGYRKIGWYSPIDNDDYSKETMSNLRIYTDEATCAEFEDIGEGQNENLGRDLAPMEAGQGGRDLRYNSSGDILFKKHPIIWTPQLDDTGVYTAATNPVYMVDHSTFFPVVLKGDFLRESSPEKVPNQHNAFRIFVDLSYNYVCVNRRRNALFAKS